MSRMITYKTLFSSAALRLVAVVALVFFMTGCAWMGLSGDDTDEARIEGERISVLQLQKKLEIEADANKAAPDIPAAWQNALWPQAGGYPNHAMGNLRLSEGRLERQWSTNIGKGSSRHSRLSAQPVVVNEVIYTLSADAVVSAVDANDGKKLWQVSVVPEDEKSETLGGGIGFGDGKVIVSAGFNEILALNPDDGEKVWTHYTGAPVRAAPSISSGRVFIISTDNQLTALNAEDGSLLWRHAGIPEEEGVLGSVAPAIAGDLVVAVYSSGEVFGLHAANGRLLWSDNLSTISRAGTTWRLSDVRAIPVIDQDRVLVAGLADRTLMLDRRSGERVWQKDVGAFAAPIIAGDALYQLTPQNELVAMLRETGEIIWIKSLRKYVDRNDKRGAVIWSAPIMAGDRLILSNSLKDVVEILPMTGDTIREWKLGTPSVIQPVVAEQTLYFMSDEGHLIAYR